MPQFLVLKLEIFALTLPRFWLVLARWKIADFLVGACSLLHIFWKTKKKSYFVTNQRNHFQPSILRRASAVLSSFFFCFFRVSSSESSDIAIVKRSLFESKEWKDTEFKNYFVILWCGWLGCLVSRVSRVSRVILLEGISISIAVHVSKFDVVRVIRLGVALNRHVRIATTPEVDCNAASHPNCEPNYRKNDFQKKGRIAMYDRRRSRSWWGHGCRVAWKGRVGYNSLPACPVRAWDIIHAIKLIISLECIYSVESTSQLDIPWHMQNFGISINT